MKKLHAAVVDKYIYNPETGLFYYRRQSTRRKVDLNKPVSSFHVDGYIHITFNKKSYRAHRLAWFYVYGEWPKFEIDHIDRNRSNNAIKNLRDVPHKEHVVNRSPTYGYGEYMPSRGPNTSIINKDIQMVMELSTEKIIQKKSVRNA